MKNIKLRLHHLIDILAELGQQSLQNMPLGFQKNVDYGHSLHAVTQLLLNYRAKTSKLNITLAVESDDLCKGCRYLTPSGQCSDVLAQLKEKPSKQIYNDELDAKLLNLFKLENKQTLSLTQILNTLQQKQNAFIPLATHPKEDISIKKKGLQKGLQLFN